MKLTRQQFEALILAELEALSDQICVYQKPLENFCDTTEMLREQVRITLLHEIGHYFGLDEDRLTELGYE